MYSRKVINKKIKYYKNGKEVENVKIIEKLKSIIVPMTYTDVKLYPDEELQATALDATGRKQYFYSKTHNANACQKKNCNLIHLAKKLPLIMRDINNALNSNKMDQVMLDALALKTMMLCNFRVGNHTNRKKYKS